jgi:N-ethylmaleimide reductase
VTEVLVASPDLVSFAAPYIRNSDLAERLRLGAPPAEPERTTSHDGDRHGYPDYPGWHRIA